MGQNQHYDLVVAGAGIAGLSMAALAAADGMKVAVLEQNYLPGGCAGSYWRKGYVFEAGATTLVGLDEGRPLHYLLHKIGVHIDALRLSVPMQVSLPSGRLLTRHADFDAFVREAEMVFGARGQRKFWEKCRQLSQIVWWAALHTPGFPPEKLSDIFSLAKSFHPKLLSALPYLFKSTRQLIHEFIPQSSPDFEAFVNEQLMITAQNTAEQTDALFGATALCYTFEGNYYLPGGMGKLSEALVNYIQSAGGEVLMRSGVLQVLHEGGGYTVHHQKGSCSAAYFVSAIPLPNTLAVFKQAKSGWSKKLMAKENLNSAYQLNIAGKTPYTGECLHRQIHLSKKLPGINAGSIFVSMSHPADTERAPVGMRVLSVSTHLAGCAPVSDAMKHQITEAVLEVLAGQGLMLPENVAYMHASVTQDWQKWTGRADGFVGGYPRFAHIPVWKIPGHRLDGKKAYICGDSVYPGQGIPGAVAGAIAAFEKLKSDDM